MRSISIAVAVAALCGALLIPTVAAQQPDTQPKAPPSLTPRIVEALEKGDFATAARALEDFLFAHTGHREAISQLAFSYSRLDRNEEAAELYGELIRLNPENYSARINLGVLLMKADRSEEAVTEFRFAAGGRPDDFRAHFYLATALEKTGKFEEAIERYARAVELEPSDADARAAAAELVVAQKDLVNFGPMLDRLLKAAPTDIVLLELRATALRLEDRPKEVLALYNAYLATVNELPGTPPLEIATVQHRAGLAAHSMKLFEEAIQHYQIAGAMGGAQFEWASVVGQARALSALERFAEAVPLYRRTLELSGHDADLDLHEEFGIVLFMTSDYAGAATVLNEVTRLDPSREESFNRLAYALHRLERHAEVVAALDHRARSHAETPGTIFLRALSQDRLGRCAEAIAGYQRFLDVNQGKENDEYFQASGRLRGLKKTCRESR